MALRTLRLQRGWSQDHLAQLSGLSIRTIQRFENGENASLETLKSLAAVFEVSIQELQAEDSTELGSNHNKEIRKAVRHVRKVKAFYSHLISYGVVIVILGLMNLITSSNTFWVVWPAMGWGIGIFVHGFKVFKPLNLFGSQWKNKQLSKRLNNINQSPARSTIKNPASPDQE